MKRPLDDDETMGSADDPPKRRRGEGPRVELRILLQSKVGWVQSRSASCLWCALSYLMCLSGFLPVCLSMSCIHKAPSLPLPPLFLTLFFSVFFPFSPSFSSSVSPPFPCPPPPPQHTHTHTKHYLLHKVCVMKRTGGCVVHQKCARILQKKWIWENYFHYHWREDRCTKEKEHLHGVDPPPS